ncbi:MAG: hypothetical protein V9H25_06485 [Candidatus Competibacter sp.]
MKPQIKAMFRGVLVIVTLVSSTFNEYHYYSIKDHHHFFGKVIDGEFRPTKEI